MNVSDPLYNLFSIYNSTNDCDASTLQEFEQHRHS
jgi:hypothetical protein